MTPKARWGGAALLFAGVAVLQAPEAAVGRGLYWAHDLRHHHLPWRAWAAAEWGAGRVPLWNPDVANGFPMMADGQVGTFYPPNVILGFLLPADLALTWSLLLHTAWAGLGACVLLRVLGRSEVASRLGGVAYALSGFLVAHMTYAGMHAVASWFPWAMAAVCALTRDEPRPRPVALGVAWAVSVAMLLTAGHVQGAAISLLGCLLVFLARARPRHRLGVLGAGLGAAAGLLVASPQLLAAFELSAWSAREGGVSEEFAAMGALPPHELINAVLPRFWGWERPADIPLTYVHKGPLYFGTGENHWENCFYLGIPVVLLALWAIGRPGDRVWKGLAVFGVLLMLGPLTPALDLVRMLPGFDYFRFPVRFSLLLTLAVTVLAAGGLDHATAGHDGVPARRFQRLAVALLLLFTLGATLAGAAFRGAQGDIEGALLAALADRPDGRARVDAIVQGMLWNSSPLSPGVWWPATLGAATVLAWHLLRRGTLTGPSFGLVLTGLTLIDLTTFGSPYNPRTPVTVVRALPSTVHALDLTGLGRTSVVDRVQPPHLDKELMSSSLGLLYGTRDVIVLSPLLLPRNEALLGAAGLDVGLDHGPAKARAVEQRLQLVELMGVRNLLTVHRLSHPRLVPVREGVVNVYRAPYAMDRAFVVGCAVASPGPEEALEMLLTVDPRVTAVVEVDGAELPCGAQAGTARVTAYTPTRVEVAARMEAPGLLVLTDTHYPGWEASVDGSAVPILPTDVTFRGVLLGPGEHTVEFRYAPWWRATVPLALGGWLVLLLAGAAALRPRSREGSPKGAA